MRWLLVMLSLPACIESNLVICENGLACSAGQVCDLAHDRCVEPAQITACTAKDPESDCVAGEVTGGCFDGVCLPRGCGNSIVESVEQCDDGNQVSGDGCRNDCLSNELCGNGVIDSESGEQCDDANLMSHDRCDSMCVAEPSTWNVVEIIPECTSIAHDPVRDLAVCATTDSTWELSGATWQRVSTAPAELRLYWNPTASRVGGVSRSGAGWQWDGARWIPQIADAGLTIHGLTWDVARATLAILADQGLYVLDGASTWQRLADMPTNDDPTLMITSRGPYDLAYEPATRELVAFGGFDGYTLDCQDYCDVSGVWRWRWRSGSWTSASYSSGLGAVSDPVHGRLLNARMYGSVVFPTFGLEVHADNSRIRSVDGSGMITTLVGDAGELIDPISVATGGGNLYIADASQHRVFRRDTQGTLTVFAGNGTYGTAGDGGLAVDAELGRLRSIAVDPSGNVYIVDGQPRVRRVDATGIITTVAGDGTFTKSGDGGPAVQAGIGYPSAVAVDGAGGFYIGDLSGWIRHVDVVGTISTYAGTGSGAHGGDGGLATAAALGSPVGLAVDPSSGDLYVTTGNNRVRRIDATTRIITTIAGTGGIGDTGDGGPATAATFRYPNAITLDGQGRLLVADSWNGRIRRIDPTTGLISTVAGTGTLGLTGDGGPATLANLSAVYGVAVGAGGSLFIADTGDDNWIGTLNTPPSPLVQVSVRPDGTVRGTSLDHVMTWRDGAWSKLDVDVPAATPMLVAHPRAGGLVAYEHRTFGGGVEESRSFVWNGSWSAQAGPPAPGPRRAAVLSYDWLRQAAVLFGGQRGIGISTQLRDTYVYSNEGWTVLDAGAAGPLGEPFAMGFDPELPGMILATSTHVYTLRSDATTWTTLGTLPSVIGGNVASFAYDATAQIMFALSDNGLLWERRGGIWKRAPFALTIAGFRLVVDERHLNVMMLPLRGIDTRVFEYRDGWVESTPLPFPITGAASYDMVKGRVVVVGIPSTGGPTSRVALVRTTTGGNPTETCVDGEDADQDGRAACDDRDCFWTCDRCPPATSCASL